MLSRLLLTLALAILTGCGTLEKKASAINPGDTRERVREIMGAPGDRQFEGSNEAWQYGQTGAGFGYHDFRIVWFYDGKVTGLTSYKDRTPGALASSRFKPIKWEDAPTATIEIRNR